MMKILALQRDHRYTDVLKQVIMSFVSQKTDCVKKLGNSFHKGLFEIHFRLMSSLPVAILVKDEGTGRFLRQTRIRRGGNAEK